MVGTGHIEISTWLTSKSKLLQIRWRQLIPPKTLVTTYHTSMYHSTKDHNLQSDVFKTEVNLVMQKYDK
jgi:hypothetical protein